MGNHRTKAKEISEFHTKKIQIKGFIIVLIAAILFGSLGTLTNFAYEAGMSPVAFATWRELFGAIAMIILLIFGVGRSSLNEQPLSKIPRWQWRNLCIACIAFLSYTLAIFYAFIHITVALAYLLFYIYPALVTAISAVTGRELLNRQKLIALLLSLTGSFMAIVGQMSGEQVQSNWIGIGLALLAAVGMSVYFLIGRKGYPSIPASYAVTIFLIAGTILFVLVGLLLGESESLLQPFSQPSVLPLLLFAGVFAAAIPTVMLLTGIRMLGASRASILAIFEPVAGALIAALLLSQSIYSIQIIGGILILGAAYLLQRTPELKVKSYVENSKDQSNSI